MILIYLIILRITIANNGFRINLDIQFPIKGGQFVGFSSFANNNISSKLITQQTSISAYLPQNESPRMDLLVINTDNNTENQALYDQYQKNVAILSEISSCTQITNFTIYDKDLSTIGWQQYIQTNAIYIIDNTQLPCQNGTYYQRITPWINIQILYSVDNSTYVAETICEIVLIAIILIEIMAVFVLYYKMRKQKKKIKRKAEKARIVIRESSRSQSSENGELKEISNLMVQ